MTRPLNPYIVGNPVTEGRGFFGRKELLARIQRELTNPNRNHLVLYGPRRIGKTSVLRQLEQTLPDDRFLPISFSLHPHAKDDLKTILGKLAEEAQDAADVTLPGLEGMDERYFRKKFLPALVKASHPRRPVFLLDEFDALEGQLGEHVGTGARPHPFLSAVEQALETSRETCFVLVLGRRIEDHSLALQHFARSAHPIPIWTLEPDDAKTLILQGQEHGGFVLEPAALEAILSLAGCHPMLTQLHCDRLWDRFVEQEASLPVTLSKAEIYQVLPAVLEGGDAGLNHWWNGVPIADRLVASALASELEPGDVWTEAQVRESLSRRSARLRGARFEGAADSLVRSWILEARGGGYTFALELFRRWLEARHPWGRTRALLDELNAEAPSLFSEGQDFLLKGALGQAAERFRQALSRDPLHLKAHLGLGEALLKNGEHRDAVEILEQAYQLEPDDAAPLLRQAREGLAQARAREDRAANAQPTSRPESEARSPAPAEPEGALAKLRSKVEEIFCQPGGSFGQYSNLDAGKELIPGLLVHFILESPKQERVGLQLFADLKGLGGQLWEQQARALMQLSATNHPAIPRIEDGGYLEGEDLAFVITRTGRDSLAAEGAMAHLRSHPLDALRAFLHLTEALAVLHGNGLLHRNLTPHSVSVWDDASPMQVCLSRFEMSVLLSNLLRRVSSGQRAPHLEQVRRYYLQHAPEILLSHPPERLEQLFDSESGTAGSTGHSSTRTRTVRNTVEPAASDLYSLGILAWQWFVEALPQELVRQTFANHTWDRSSFDSLHRELRSRLTQAGLPRPISDLIGRLIDPDPRGRGTSAEARDLLRDAWMVLQDHWSSTRSARKLLIATLPEKYGEELRRRGKLEYDPKTEQGVNALLDYMRDDLRGATLTWAERGYAPYASREDEDARTTQYVVVGLEHVYFCRIFERRKSYGNQPPIPLPQVLFCRFSMEKRYFFGGDHRQAGRPLPLLEPLSMRSTRLDSPNLKDEEHWTPYLEAVRPSTSRSDWQNQLDEGLTWLLQAQKTQLDARIYAFTREPDALSQTGQGNSAPAKRGPGAGVRLRFDQARDDKRRHEDPLLNLFASANRRPDFGDFFKQLREDDDVVELACYPDRNGEPLSLREHAVKVRFLRQADPHVLDIKLDENERGSVPEKGWLAPRLDVLSRPVLQRQERALGELLEQVELADQLRQPRAIFRPFRGRLDSVAKLEGNAPQIIEDILSLEPFYALHGPPGTGKTTVAARALEALLTRDHSARVLVSAQSHYALDNLAERLLARVKHLDLVAVRIYSEHAGDRVDASMHQFAPERLAADRIERIRKACSERLERRQDPPALLKVIAAWRDQAEKSAVELRNRLARGANLVFATCNVAARERVELAGEFDAFDLVIVEEAAKAWPTELLVPLVRGRRWLLIGDHRQLPAYQKNEIVTLLRACASSTDPVLKRLGDKHLEIEKIFDLFKGLFSRPLAKSDNGLFRDPRSMLGLQFRMAPPIGKLISAAFYDGKLETAPSTNQAHGLSAPAFVKERSLIWLDTNDLPRNREKPTWSNPQEVKVVLELLRQLRPVIGKKEAAERLAILAPYREQVELLRRAILSGDAESTLQETQLPKGLTSSDQDKKKTGLAHLADCVHTVDSFQGREAELVIVSLTRFNDIDALKAPRRRLGHMAAPERINVMLSRAKRLLVVVGSFAFYKESGLALEALSQASPSELELGQNVEGEVHWAQICRAIEEQQAIVPASLVLPDDAARGAGNPADKKADQRDRKDMKEKRGKAR